MNYSLRQLLLVALLSASMLIWGITAFINYKVTRDEVAALFDAELAQSAKVLNTFVEGLAHGGSLEDHWKKDKDDNSLSATTQKKIDLQLSSEEHGLFLHPQSGLSLSFDEKKGVTSDSALGKILNEVVQADLFSPKYARKIAFQLWSKKGRMLFRTQSAPEFEEFSSRHQGPSNKTIDGELWHVFSITNNSGEYVIHIGQKEEIRSQLSDEISSHLVTQFLIGLPFLGAVIWLIVGQALRPINRLERQLSRREASYLKPLSTKKLPNEILPVVNEINNLFVQLERAFEHERRFSADASHELRTPLAGLLTQAQVALRTTDDDVRTQALQRIKQAVNRMTYMVQQLLTFSRIESNTEFLTKESTVLSREVVQVIADLEPAAHKKRILMEFEEFQEMAIVVNAPLINILLRNVIDNAIKYTPPQGSIMISVTGMPKHLQFCVEDSGPGISPDQYEKSLKRFHRCQETANTAPGSGLGFSIVQRIVSIHGAELVLGVSKFGGLKVTVLFPLPKQKKEKTWQNKLSFFNTAKNQ
ncbi:MAG: two-component sensor histidine kinase [Methylococcaceae bacterium]|nr:two-component sensor histidine kinase [Methylococcaceae bacterium]